MIPEEIGTFLEHASVGFAATRDAALTPQVHLVLGWTVGDGRQTITCLFPKSHSKVLVPSLENNGQFALTVLGSTAGPKASRPPKPDVDFHECYQFKGTYLASRPADETDGVVVDRTEKRFHQLLGPLMGLSEEVCAARFGKPVLAMTFKVDAIFDQTPGPGAGRKIAPEE